MACMYGFLYFWIYVFFGFAYTTAEVQCLTATSSALTHSEHVTLT